ncbi:response regulator [Rhodococcus sp. NPDC059968]|uniref:response regulator n=1 Tax=Rhodococcus sp. NPDC059968 TaxID=3347017 RepID=UPI00366BC264
MPPSPLVVVIVDDHALFAQGLQLLLGSSHDGVLTVGGWATSSEEAVALVGRHRADIATIDLTLPPGGGVKAIAEVKKAYPQTRVLALSGTDDLTLAESALRAGADGFLAKTSDPEALIHPLLTLASGIRVVSPEILDALLTSSRKPEDGLLVRLASREIQLWSLLAQGLETAELAKRLLVSERTAKRMVASLLNKIGAANRIEAAALAGRCGLIDDRTFPGGR